MRTADDLGAYDFRMILKKDPENPLPTIGLPRNVLRALFRALNPRRWYL
jgi:hypothetical protein